MGWKLLSLHSREQHALPSAKFGLNSIAYPCSSVSHPNASLVKKTPGCGKKNMCKFARKLSGRLIRLFVYQSVLVAICTKPGEKCLFVPHFDRTHTYYRSTYTLHLLIKRKIWL